MNYKLPLAYSAVILSSIIYSLQKLADSGVDIFSLVPNNKAYTSIPWDKALTPEEVDVVVDELVQHDGAGRWVLHHIGGIELRSRIDGKREAYKAEFKESLAVDQPEAHKLTKAAILTRLMIPEDAVPDYKIHNTQYFPNEVFSSLSLFVTTLIPLWATQGVIHEAANYAINQTPPSWSSLGVVALFAAALTTFLSAEKILGTTEEAVASSHDRLQKAADWKDRLIKESKSQTPNLPA